MPSNSTSYVAFQQAITGRAPTLGPADECPLADEFWTIKHVCAYLKRGKSSVWEAVRTGRFPKPVHIGGSTRWKRSTIEEWEKNLA